MIKSGTVILVIAVLGLFCSWAMSGCTIRLISNQNDNTVEVIRNVAIESYKDGMIDILNAQEYDEEEEPLRPLHGLEFTPAPIQLEDL